MSVTGTTCTRGSATSDWLEAALVDRDVFDRRLGRLENVLRSLRHLAGNDRDSFLRDAALQAQAERWLYVATECCLDLAHHLISDRGWKTPSTYRECFQVLQSEGVLNLELACTAAVPPLMEREPSHLVACIKPVSSALIVS